MKTHSRDAIGHTPDADALGFTIFLFVFAYCLLTIGYKTLAPLVI